MAAKYPLGIARFANAVRLEYPDFQMSGRIAGVFTLVAILSGLALEVGLLLLIAPGVWIGNKLSLSSLGEGADAMAAAAAPAGR